MGVLAPEEWVDQLQIRKRCETATATVLALTLRIEVRQYTLLHRHL